MASKLRASVCAVAFLASGVRGLSVKWTITEGLRNPDCIDALAILVNGQFPGPVLEVDPGERMEVLIENQMATQSITVHFHGQHFVGAPYMDGALHMTSCEIVPNASHKYVFWANAEPGTYMYHLHTDDSNRHMGLFGMHVIRERSSDPLFRKELTGEHHLMLSDWYRQPARDIIAGLHSLAFRWAGDPNSLLINGRGQQGCFTEEEKLQGSCEKCPGLESLQVVPGGTYRLRFANVAALAYLNVAIEGHSMRVIEADGHPIKPVDVLSLDLSSGQRYSVLLAANQPPSSYRVSMLSRHRKGVRSTFAILKYTDSSTADPGPPSQAELAALHPAWDDVDFSFEQQAAYEALAADSVAVAPLTSSVTKRVVLLGTQERFADGSQKNGQMPEDHCDTANNTKALKWAINRVPFPHQHDKPVLLSAFLGETGTFTSDRGYIPVKRGDVLDVVLQNYPACNGACEVHPWHLHGHSFWVVGQGHGEWTGSDAQVAGLKEGAGAVYRDTVTLTSDNSASPYVDAEPCGWAVIRFVANNPGAWPLHCHISWHVPMGMQAVFWYADGSIPAPPENFACWADARRQGPVTMQQPVLLPTDGALQLEGACGSKAFLNSLVFHEVGATADGRPFFKPRDRWLYIYFDEACDGVGGQPAGWVIDSNRPSQTAMEDLDEDGKCDYHARWGGRSSRPPSSATWRMYCVERGGWVDVDLKLSVVVTAAAARGQVNSAYGPGLPGIVALAMACALAVGGRQG